MVLIGWRARARVENVTLHIEPFAPLSGKAHLRLPERQLALGLVAEEITRGDFLLAKLWVQSDVTLGLRLRRMFRLSGGIISLRSCSVSA
jgi:hypothetical protein